MPGLSPQTLPPIFPVIAAADRGGAGAALALDLMPMATLLLDVPGLGCLAANADAAALLGVTEAAVPAAWRGLLAGPQGRGLAARLRALPADGTVVQAELDLPAPHGAPATLLLRARRALLAGQESVILSLIEGGRRRRIEAALEDSAREARRRLGELETLYRSAPLGLGQLDADLRFVRINEALAEINGFTVDEHLGRNVWDLVPALRETAEPLLRRVLESGEPLTGLTFRGETAAAPGVEREWVEQFYPVRDPETQEVTGVGIVCEEVTDRRQVERSRALLLRELDHRVRNLFAVIGGLVTLTARGAEDAATLRDQLLARIRALAEGHELVRAAMEDRAAPQGATLAALMENVLMASLPGVAGRVLLEGPRVPVGPTAAPPLALLVHELASNARRHGAMARADGALEVAWAEQSGQVVLRWREAPLPATGEATMGLGHRLVQQCAAQLGGRITFDWQPDALRVEVTVPGARLAR